MDNIHEHRILQVEGSDVWHVQCFGSERSEWIRLFGSDILPTPYSLAFGPGAVAAALRDIKDNADVHFTWTGSPHARPQQAQ